MTALQKMYYRMAKDRCEVEGTAPAEQSCDDCTIKEKCIHLVEGIVEVYREDVRRAEPVEEAY